MNSKMKSTTRRNSILVCALLGVMVAGQALAADLRYQNSGDYTNILAIHGLGWFNPAAPGSLTTLPGSADTIRANYGNNTITLTTVAPEVRRFQLGVDESGQLVVENGGKLTTTGGANSTVGNNPNAGIIGRLTVNAGGEVIVTNVLFVGASATGILTVDGGTVLVTSHLWGGSGAVGVGTIYVTNGGTLNVGGNIGLGTVNASTASGGKCSVFVQEGGALNLSNIDGAGNSIWPNSVLDISGSGVVTIPGDRTTVMGNYTNAGEITAYGGTGTVGIDYNNTNVGKTTLWAIAPVAPPPTDVVWLATSGTGLWNESANWSGGVAPASVTKVNFNVPGTIPCTVTNVAVADYVVMGENGPGGAITVADGGILTLGAANASVIGLNSNALMTVQAGGAANFGGQLRIGLDPGSDGTLIMNGGTVSVAGLFDLGGQGGKGTAQIKGGTLNLAQWDDSFSIQGASVLDVSGTGQVVINGNHQFSVEFFVSTGLITNSVGTNVVVDYNNINVGKTTIYPAGLYVAPERATWDPASNPSGNGFWNESSNWTGGVVPGSVTLARFNLGATPCTVSNAAVARVVRMGIDGGAGGTLIITNGGSLVCTVGDDNWSAIGYNQTAEMIVEAGGSASFGNHLWVGFSPGGDGTLIMNGGTVSVTAMFGLGWNGGKGTAQINGGTLNLSQWHPTDSIKGDSVLNVAGTGKVVITGDYFASVGNFVSAGKITANGGPNVFYFYDAAANKTYISAVLLPAPQQAITAVSVSDGNVSITYQTTHQHTYYIAGSPSLSPASWTPVPGSTNVATGAPVTFTFPVSGDQMFYRTVAP